MEEIAKYIGYLASLFLIISLSVNGDVKFRIYNLLGCLCFIVYGSIFNAWPVILTNTILLFINIYYLIKLHQHRENFDLVEIKAGDKLVEKFISFYKTDIDNFYPGFTVAQLEGNINFIVLRDLVIANIFSAKVVKDGDALVVINYTIKKYRDYKVSKFIFEKKQIVLSEKGIKRILYNQSSKEKYAKFFDVMKFENDGTHFYKTIQ
jgi:hypothetical protein